MSVFETELNRGGAETQRKRRVAADDADELDLGRSDLI